jgi:outer membrane murein-binding lipoprotein Lpp
MKRPLILMSVVFLSLPIPAGPTNDRSVEDLTARVKKLEIRQEKLMQDVVALSQSNSRLAAWAEQFPALCNELDLRMDSARKNGFEYAGAHPKAKKDVLDGIKAFAQGVSHGLKKQSKK